MTKREGGSHLLYVDPDPAYRRNVPSALEPEWVVTAAESVEAATAAMDGSFDCVVAADELPEMGGLEFLDSVESETDETPFVLFTAEEDIDLVRQAFRAGINDVIYKQRSSDVTADGEPDSSTDMIDSTDGIVGLRHCLDSLDIGSTDLNGITLDVSRSLMGAAADEVDMKTEWALQSLAEEIDANQCLIYEVDDGTRLELTHGWTDDEIGDSETHRQLFGVGSETVPADQFPGFGSQLQQFEPACVDITAAAEPEPTGGTATTPASNGDSGTTAVVSSEASPELPADGDRGTLLALPVVIEWQLSGTIVITVEQPREWSEEARQRLQAVGELVGHMERRRRQRQELERQNEQLEQFASVISHDLQNPLNVISGYLELAMETGNLDRLDPALDAAERMEEMLDDLLTLAREGRAVGETQEVELQPIVQEAWESVETYDGSLELVGLDDLDPVEADGSRLQEAFENLFKNAVVHAGKDVNLRVEADDGTVYIADDGQGIPEDKRDVVFEYGHTGGDGTGLGLAIVRSIIEGHDWEIEAAESEEGGARFDIDLGR
ncbi:ATP-binding response regulator [Halohasta litorea]|uniref:histidine kinase n=1 Tax=Halohasta litorea TaxID=869891 RepID=A0ABD6DCX9_9EURY|nr:hybrid sensor histidine kinase/response regulator [Halohasta litorea]